MAATATVDHRTDAERLREQAAALQRTADRMAEQRMEILREAWALEADADRLERDAPRPVTIAPAARKISASTEHDAALMTRVVELMSAMGDDMASSEVALHMGVSQTRARAVLTRLEAIGMVTRVGIKSATRYRLTTEDEVPTPTPTAEANVHEFGNYRTVVRDAAINLGTFEFADLMEALPDMSEGTVRRWLKAMQDDGMFEDTWVDGRKVYAYVKPEGTTTARPRRATPEAEAMREHATAQRGTVAGTGRARVGTPIVDALIREVAPYGVTVTFSKHRVEYRLGGRVIATSSKTPAASSLKGTRGELRKAGIPV